MLHIGNRIETVLEQKGMMRTAMGRKIGEILKTKPPSSQAMRGWVLTGRIDEKWLPAIAQALDVSLEWLVGSKAIVSVDGIPVDVAKQAAIQAYSAAQAVGGLDAEQFAKMFLLFCKVDDQPTAQQMQRVQTISGNHNNNTQMGDISIGQLKGETNR